MRAQSQNEKTQKNENKLVRRKDLDVWRFQQIADCCAFFQQLHKKSQTRINVVSFLHDSNDVYWESDERFRPTIDSLKENGLN